MSQSSRRLGLAAVTAAAVGIVLLAAGAPAQASGGTPTKPPKQGSTQSSR
ncbi:hypothetical protein [Rhizocola hellebori]|nr:hypothetical protein [Rhizocola hellebori]